MSVAGALKIEGTGLQTFVTLNDGHKMPMFGLGCFKSQVGDETQNAVVSALKSGYRMIDTATFYNNEASVGLGIKKSGVKREDVFVVTKLMFEDHGFDKCTTAFHDSLKRLDTGYVDLYLIHAPTGGKILETWDAMVELKGQGLIRSIGVSNFGVHHLEELLSAGRQAPAVNQIELNPFWRQEANVEYCRQKGIAVEGYCPLFRGRYFDDPTLQSMASKYNKTVAQLLIRWSVQMKYITIPKSSNIERIIENSRVFDFEIAEDDMKILDAMPTERCGFPGKEDPTVCPWTG